MDESTLGQKYVVTVLRGHTPIAVVELQPHGEADVQLDVLHPEDQPLGEIVDALHSALHGVQFLRWKRDGVLPAPPDLRGEEEQDTDIPF